MRNAHTADSQKQGHGTARRRAKPSNARLHARPETGRERPVPKLANLYSKRVLLIVESEGAVFDTLSFRHEKAYLPAFVGCFSRGLDPVFCARLWREIALSSRFRGQDPFVILLTALRHMNRLFPSVRRAAVIKTLDGFLSGPARDLFRLAEAGPGTPERTILDWISMSDSLLEDEGRARLFEGARDFLKLVKHIAPGTEVLAFSSLEEAEALNQWEMEDLGDCFMRIAGSERGSMPEYARAALRYGYDKTPILIAGSTFQALTAAQTAGARFYPIMPYREEESWEHFSEVFFPAFMQGDASPDQGMMGEFMRMLYADIDPAAILAACPVNRPE